LPARLITRRVLAPFVAGARQVVGHSEFRLHVLRIKFRGPFQVKIRRDEGQVIVNFIPLGQDVDAVPALKGIGHSQDRAMSPHGEINLHQVFP
jgi:hypothetical protein